MLEISDLTPSPPRPIAFLTSVIDLLFLSMLVSSWQFQPLFPSAKPLSCGSLVPYEPNSLWSVKVWRP